MAAVETCKHIGAMVEQGWEIVLTHGNDPRVGFIQRRSELAITELPPVPLDHRFHGTKNTGGRLVFRGRRQQSADHQPGKPGTGPGRRNQDLDRAGAMSGH